MIEYTVYRVEDDGTTTEISRHESIGEGCVAAAYIVEHVDHDYAYALYSGANRVASFREGRTGYRAWATRTGRISPSLEDKYDHDEDMLLA